MTDIQEKAKKAIAKTKKPGTMMGLKANDVKDIIGAYRLQIAQALPKHLTADRVIQMSTTLIARTPELAQCSVESLVGGVMQASILGFEPVAALGQCYFVPFNNNKNHKKEVQFIIGYKGFLDLARRSGQIETIYAQVVYENDDFEYEFGLEPKLKHVPALDGRGTLTHVYAVAKFQGGGYAFEVMSKSDVDKIRKSSKAGQSQYSPWSTYYDEMARKTVIRKLSKYLPLSLEHQKSILSDESSIKPDSYVKDKDGVSLDLDAVDVSDYEEVPEPEPAKPEPKKDEPAYISPDEVVQLEGIAKRVKSDLNEALTVFSDGDVTTPEKLEKADLDAFVKFLKQ